jgi:hypothetical protein
VKTFAEFQATRREVPHLGDVIDEPFVNKTPGFVYLDRLYIEKRAKWWPEELKARGQFYLRIENQEYVANELDLLECRLYVWAADAGYLGEKR